MDLLKPLKGGCSSVENCINKNERHASIFWKNDIWHGESWKAKMGGCSSVENCIYKYERHALGSGKTIYGTVKAGEQKFAQRPFYSPPI